MGLGARQRRDADGDVLKQLDENAAKATKHHRPKERITLEAYDHFDPFGRHALHDNAFDLSGRTTTVRLSLDSSIGIAYFGGIGKPKRPTADVALMRNLGGFDLEGDGESHAFGGGRRP